MLKVYQNIYPTIIFKLYWNIHFHWRDMNDNLQRNPEIVVSNVRCVSHGGENMSCFVPEISDIEL